MASEEITIRAEPADQPDVTALLLQARTLLAGLYPPESRHGLDLDAYASPDVTLFVARAGGQAVGCGAFKRHRDGSAEIKSMFVIPRRAGAASGAPSSRPSKRRFRGPSPRCASKPASSRTRRSGSMRPRASAVAAPLAATVTTRSACSWRSRSRGPTHGGRPGQDGAAAGAQNDVRAADGPS